MPVSLQVFTPSVQFISVAQSCLTLYNPMDCKMPGLHVHHQFPETTQLWSTESMMLWSLLILCRRLLLLPSIFPSIRVFSNESVLCVRCPKCWSFSFSISPSNEHSGLIFLRLGWLYLLPVQGTLKSLLQHHSSKASILQRSAFFIFQFSHPYMTTGKTTALTRCTFVGKVMFLLFNMLSMWIITFLPRSKRLLISWLQSPSAVILLLLLLSHFSCVRLCATPLTAAHQAPPSFGFSRQEHWSGFPFPSPMHESEKWKWSRSVMSNSQRPHGLQPTRLLRPWDFPGKSSDFRAPPK